MTGAVIPTSVDAELGTVLADVVDDLLELAVELEGLGLEAVVGARQGDSGLGAACDDDQVVRGQLDDDGIPAVGVSGNMNTADASDGGKRPRSDTYTTNRSGGPKCRLRTK